MKLSDLYTLLVEMPQTINVKLKMDQEVAHIRNHWDAKGTIILDEKKYEMWQFGTKEIDVALIANNQVMLESSFELYGKGINANYVQQNELVRGLARAFYTQYLIKEYDFILSDSTMTTEGVNFWIKLFEQFGKQFLFKIYDAHSHNLTTIKNTDQMRAVASPEKRHHHYRFLLQPRRS